MYMKSLGREYITIQASNTANRLKINTVGCTHPFLLSDVPKLLKVKSGRKVKHRRVFSLRVIESLIEGVLIDGRQRLVHSVYGY